MLFFVDNIYRFTLAGTEVSALLGRMPSAVGYQPTLAEEMGRLQERITSTKTGSITSIQAVYVPADDLTDPSPATTFAHLDSTVVLSRDIASLGIYPAVDPLDSTSRQLDPNVVGEEHYNTARARAGDAAALQGTARHHRDPRAWTSCRPKTSSRWRARARSSASSESQMIDFLVSCSGGKKTVVTATHDLDLVEDIADTCHVFQRGRIVATGTPSEILNDHALLLSTNLIHAHRHAHASGDLHSHPHRHGHRH